MWLLNRQALLAGSRLQPRPLRSFHSGGALRTASSATSSSSEKKDVAAPTAATANVKPEVAEKVGFFTKLKYRFKGIPLKDELHPPVSFMRDIGKQFIPPPLPQLPKDFKEYPERDLENYPYPVKRMYAPKLRLLIIPDKFMNAFHSITGTSGPYVFFGLLYVFLHSKGLFEIAHDRVKVMIILFYYYILSRAFDYRWDKYFYENMKKVEKKYLDIMENNFRAVREVQQTSKEEKNAYAAIKEYYPAIFKENLALQLEATYRKNVEMLATEMKRRLDYLQETEAVKRSFARDHMLKWIIDSVRAEILANKEGIKERYMESCIGQLKELSLK